MCAFYSYSDLARKNFEICREVILVFENGDARCDFLEKDGRKIALPNTAIMAIMAGYYRVLILVVSCPPVRSQVVSHYNAIC